jgi:hypothetical protein
MNDRNGTEIVVGTFVSEVGTGGTGCVIAVDVIVAVEKQDMAVVSWLSGPAGRLMAFDPYDLMVLPIEEL